jgi:Cu/Ag efflux pump CusA
VSVGGPNSISRENVQRKIVVSANTSGRDVVSIVNEIEQRVNEHVNIPENYLVEYGGQFQSAKKASRTLLLMTIIAIFVIFLLLYGEFKDVTLSAITLINLPLALIGGVFAIFISSNTISIPAIIGFITLFGIATRNGILLISRYQYGAAHGVSLRQAIIDGSRDRLNPILMTALTSALALIPMVINGSQSGNEIQSPMAVVVLGGLLTSTLLNVYVIPIVYEMIHAKKQSSQK